MQQPNLVTIEWKGRPYEIPHHLAGGTADAPTPRAGYELLLNWAAGGPTNILNDPSGLLARLVEGDPVREIDHRLRKPATHPVTEPFPPAAVNLMLLPKSLELFELYLAQLRHSATPDTKLAVAFPTKLFTPRLLEIAAAYAGGVEQSRAWKKHRLLLLSDFHSAAPDRPLHEVITYRETDYYRMFGTFCAGHIDYGTQFLLDRWEQSARLGEIPAPVRLLDACCGLGVIAHQLSLRYPAAEVRGFDSSHPAIASARENDRRLGPFGEFLLGDATPDGPYDLIVMNPPFHEERRTTVAIALDLFRQAARQLVRDGRLVVVGNRHLGYGKHLGALFATVQMAGESDKFAVYLASEPTAGI